MQCLITAIVAVILLVLGKCVGILSSPRPEQSTLTLFELLVQLQIPGHDDAIPTSRITATIAVIRPVSRKKSRRTAEEYRTNIKLKIWSESSFCSTSGARHVILVTNPLICYIFYKFQNGVACDIGKQYQINCCQYSMSVEIQQHLRRRFKYVSVTNWNEVECIPGVNGQLRPEN
jgi:hypothetical protein